MCLLLIFIIGGLPWMCFTQVAEQDNQTTKPTDHTPQVNSTVSTGHISSNASAASASEEQETSKEQSQSSMPDDIRTTMASLADYFDTSTSTQINQHSVTNSPHAGNWMESTMTHTTTVPSKETATLSSDVVSTVRSPPDSIFEDFIDLTSENISHCFRENEALHFNSVSGQIVFSQKNFDIGETCIIEFMVPSNMVLQMFTSMKDNPWYSYSLTLTDDSGDLDKRIDSDIQFLLRVVSLGNTVTFQLTRDKMNSSVDLFFNFTAVPPPQLQTIFITPKTGYVQTPDWDGRTNYPNNMDIWTQLDVPINSSVMVSFRAMDIEHHKKCEYDRLTIHVGGHQTVKKTIKLIQCNGNLVLKPTIFQTTVLLFHFKSDWSVAHLGFRLHFSFHDRNEVPGKLNNGKWNCSVPHWPNFQLHFNCNLVEECSAGEDEEHCDYRSTSDRCGKGFLSIGKRCYIFISGVKHITWNEAANECLRHKGYLASLNSPEEWEEVIAVVRERLVDAAYFGLRVSGSSLPEKYSGHFQWADGSVVLYTKVGSSSSYEDCSVLRWSNWQHDRLKMVECDKSMTSSFLCEVNHVEKNDPLEKAHDIVMTPPERQSDGGGQYVTCPAGHTTLMFLACDVQSMCWGNEVDASPSACDYPIKPPPPSLQCTNGRDHVPYTLVCDHRPDCSDDSDENFCVFPSCMSEVFQCTNKQCVAPDKRCDNALDCLDGSDERQCPLLKKTAMLTSKPPAIVQLDGHGSYKVNSITIHANQSNDSLTGICPDTHFLCPGNLTYCMPVFVRCNGVYDCPGREDEEGCDRYQCPGFYRCRASPICVHASHLCDGVYQCPQHDDELLCDVTCPQKCTCYGLAFYCHGQFPTEQYRDLRYLHAHESGLTPNSLKTNYMLVYLNLAKCNLTSFNHAEFPNLRTLDLRDNELTSFSTTHMQNMSNLQMLYLAENPLLFLFDTVYDPLMQFSLLQTIDLSNVILLQLNVTTLLTFPKLTFLNLSGSGTERISGEGFQSLAFLKYLDIRGCPMTEFPRNIFEGLRSLKKVWADNYKLCCSATLPEGFHPMNCHAPSDEISSCDALLRSDFYRIVLSVFAVLALIGNFCSFVYRGVVIKRDSSNLGFGVFVTHLCVSDFLMGVYLAVIGIADRMYQGNYIWKDAMWKQSAGCKVAGFLSLLSSEVSAFIICLITLDRFLVLRFPFSNLYFKKKSAHVACMIAWLIGIVLAGIPLLPVTAHWHFFYSQNGICIPLPITRNDFAGHDYSFGVMIILNFILFIFIAAGQSFVYWSIRTNSMTPGDSNNKSNDLTIARRLITIAMSDFLCWFPIGLLGVLASSGVSIPGEVNVAIAIIALPVNSAINPFLYTINSLLERREKARYQKIQKMMMSSFASKYTGTVVDRLDENYTQTEALKLVSEWLSHNLLPLTKLEKILFEEKQKSKTSTIN